LIVAVHQPQYLPWIGYFDKMRRADVFCYLDDVQYKKNEWQNRNRIKTAQDWQWLTVPVHYLFPAKINEVQINNTTHWSKKHHQALITNYSRAPYFKAYISIFEDIFSKEWDLISELNIHLVERLKSALQLQEKTTAGIIAVLPALRKHHEQPQEDQPRFRRLASAKSSISVKPRLQS